MKLNNGLRKIANRQKELSLLFKHYSYLNDHVRNDQLFISMIDGRLPHGGLSDRLKGAISLYAFCKAREKKFRLNFCSPFDISDYLIPNKYDWSLKSNECVSKSICNVRILIMISEFKAERLIGLNSNKQIHFYDNLDIVEVINLNLKKNYTWAELFNELFKPAPLLKAEIDHHLKLIGSNYIGAVFRFQQLLGDFKEYDFPILKEDKQLELVNKCKNAILILRNKYAGNKILITSDSHKFLNYITDIDSVYTLPGKVVHMDVTKNEVYDVYMKSFLDMFMLSHAEAIFSVGTKEMYPSEFPLYASKIRNIPFERVLID